MDHAQHNTIVNFIWGIADDVLRDVYVRGKYRDVILPDDRHPPARLRCWSQPSDAVLEQKASSRRGRDRRTRTPPSARPPGRPSTTPRHSRSATLLDHAASSSSQTSRPTSTASRPTCRRSSRSSSSATKSRRLSQARRARPPDREVPRPLDQPQPEARAERRRQRAAARPRQPRAWARSSRS